MHHLSVFAPRSPHFQAHQTLVYSFSIKLAWKIRSKLVSYFYYNYRVPSLMSPPARIFWSFSTKVTAPSAAFSNPWLIFTPARWPESRNSRTLIVRNIAQQIKKIYYEVKISRRTTHLQISILKLVRKLVPVAWLEFQFRLVVSILTI